MPETPKNREVNADTEVLNADSISDSDESDAELDEEVIPPVDEEAEAEPEAEGESTKEDEATSESSQGENEQEPEKEPVQAPSKQPKPVEGETDRERALRLEVQRLKGLRRKEAITDITGEAKETRQPQAVSDRMAKLRETYSDEEIRNMEEAIDVLAESKGYVKASATYQQTVNDVVDSFVEANPEFKPENDPEDVRWQRFESILKSGTYNLAGKNPKQLTEIFKKVKRDVDEELGDPTPVAKAKAVETEVRKDAAQNHKIKSVSHSGGTKSAPAKKTTSIDPSVRKMFQGFDDEDLAD